MRPPRLATAVVAGVASVLALPPTGAAALAWVALVPLFVALDGAGRRATVLVAVVYALVLIVGDVEPWLWPASAAYFEIGRGRALGITLPPLAAVGVLHGAALGVLLLARPRRPGPAQVLAGAAAWVVWDALRTRVFPYHPGGVVGLSQWATTPVLQVASVTGIAGVSFLVVACNAGLAALILAPEGRGRAAVATGVGLAAVAAAVGLVRTREPLDRGPQTVLATVDLGARSPAEGTLDRYREASGAAAPAALLVWPESAVLGDPTRDPRLLAALRDVVGARGIPLLAGGLGSVLRADRRGFTEFNSAYLVTPDGGIEAYHKRLLVPFAERWPALLGAPPASLGVVEAGRGATLFRLAPDTPFGVLICFEITAPDGARELAQRGARFLVNLTNDAWFAAAPHLPWAAVRAVETGVPVVRAANHGVSAVFDRLGRRRDARPSGPMAELSVPPAAPTVYARSGDAFLFLCGAGLVLAALRRR